MDMSAIMDAAMICENNNKICPFRTAVGSTCVKERCALWKQMKNDSGEDVSACGFLMAANALVHLATVGMDVFPG